MTTVKKVLIEREIVQVKDGIDYKGYLKFGGVRFDYEMTFTVHVNQLANMKPLANLDEARRIFVLILKRDGVNLEMEDEEYYFFFSMLAESIIDFYHHPQTRETNEGLFGKVLRSEGLFGGAATGSVSMNGHVNYTFEPGLCKMLSVPKFGCVFA